MIFIPEKMVSIPISKNPFSNILSKPKITIGNIISHSPIKINPKPINILLSKDFLPILNIFIDLNPNLIRKGLSILKSA